MYLNLHRHLTEITDNSMASAKRDLNLHRHLTENDFSLKGGGGGGGVE